MDKHSWLFGLFVTTKGGMTKSVILIFPKLELINAELNHVEYLQFSSGLTRKYKTRVEKIFKFKLIPLLIFFHGEWRKKFANANKLFSICHKKLGCLYPEIVLLETITLTSFAAVWLTKTKNMYFPDYKFTKWSNNVNFVDKSQVN